ncbi:MULTISPECIES: hypothetical protein [unclassified Marinobacter]|uniref:hypothetical protein n=1 Tax=unclassified Marinobacter TaxID=83889 RepID=UPI001908F030|nr:hypothetical protein [Marinobacter sp. 1-4A]MBK1853093.1 hypothetical protein [Marinobacter sp. 1-4A]
MSQPVWKRYESASREILQHFASELGIISVDGEAVLPGSSGTKWHVEGTATCLDEGGFLILECRRYTAKRLNQESLGGLAFRILDTGGAGAIIVTPLPLQQGAKLVAESQNIVPVEIAEWSTAQHYLARILGKTFHGFGYVEAIQVSASSVVSIQLTRASASEDDS